MDFDEPPEDLADTLALEPIEVDLFRGMASIRDGSRIFGGHVVAQALLAACATVEGRVCHSLHCYFIRPGDTQAPILYEVDRARDGATFTTRRVRAIQHGKSIFNFAASFQIPEDGFEHQFPMPDAASPDGLPDLDQVLKAHLGHHPEFAKRLAIERAIEQRAATPLQWGEKSPAINNVWIRARAPIGPDLHLHQAFMAYASDLGLLATCMRPHALNWQTPGLQTASLDHAMWFHRPFDFNRWHLYAQDGPVAYGARGFNRGQMFSRDGVLVASVAQEGLVRLRKA